MIFLEEEIAKLINTHNRIPHVYTTEEIHKNIREYLVKFSNESMAPSESVQVKPVLASVVRLKPVQWYQLEVCHLVTKPEYRNQGYASSLLMCAIQMAYRQQRAILQATIRSDNLPSLNLFEKMGFQRSMVVINPKTNHELVIVQKGLHTPYSILEDREPHHESPESL